MESGAVRAGSVQNFINLISIGVEDCTFKFLLAPADEQILAWLLLHDLDFIKLFSACWPTIAVSR